MLRRLKLSPQSLMFLEAGLIGLFFIQALRFLVGMLYNQSAGASITLTIQQLGMELLTPNPTDPAAVTRDITFSLLMLGLPVITLIFGRVRPFIMLAVLITAVGRAFMSLELVLTPTASAALVVGGGLMYVAYLARYRANLLPYMFVLALGADQLLRAYGNTLDPSWSIAYQNIQIGLSFLAVLLALFTVIWTETTPQPPLPAPQYGLIPFWGGIGLGALLFLQLSLLGMPNAIAGRADYEYTILVPLVTAATLLPLIPAVRGRVGAFIGTFDSSVRGWLWMLVIVLLIVAGTRLTGLIAAIALVISQFLVSTLWWWMLRRRTAKDRSFSGLWLVLGVLVFALLVACDLFTYEYAYVRSFSGDLAFLNDIIVPLLRGFSGLGIAVIILSVFLAALPMTQIRQRIPLAGGPTFMSIFALLVVAAASVGAYLLARPPVIQAPAGLEVMRVATYNIHGGTNEYFQPSLEEIATAIETSGANVVLLQEVEVGRLTSFGVDQALWLARNVGLGMDRRFYPTNEGLRGLAVLSSLPIAFDDGAPLSAIGERTGLQRVQIQPTPDSVITLYNTWLGYLLEPTEGLTIEAQEQDQQRQLGEIFQIIESHHPNGVLGRTIIGGTFNNVPDSPLVERMRQVGFIDPFAGMPVELGATLVRSGVARARLDYLWLRNLNPAEGVLVLDNPASDHRLAVAGILVE
ncbi:MAG: endonuclease/exonuclease/phosphatase family protein [Pleurocapsa minor GSE-CHR-MK-17-07R]|jgi:endonuclease/exonuclease/phosphatase family metal-dependent hydrolase|nr:endonuclease/exonuclease/phosphatase family protein [Pleurocapsa minor GSE-CHR-MK 17-07R]